MVSPHLDRAESEDSTAAQPAGTRPLSVNSRVELIGALDAIKQMQSPNAEDPSLAIAYVPAKAQTQGVSAEQSPDGKKPPEDNKPPDGKELPKEPPADNKLPNDKELPKEPPADNKLPNDKELPADNKPPDDGTKIDSAMGELIKLVRGLELAADKEEYLDGLNRASMGGGALPDHILDPADQRRYDRKRAEEREEAPGKDLKNRPPKQEEYLFKRLDDLKKMATPDKESIADCLSDIASMYNEKGDAAKAREYYAQASEAYKNLFGENDLNTIHAVLGLARMDKKLGNWAGASESYKRVIQGYQRYRSSINDPVTTDIPAEARWADHYRQQKAYLEHADVLDKLQRPEEARKQRTWAGRYLRHLPK